MKEISLNILDIAENSVKAKASLIQILLKQEGSVLEISIIDNGCGMTKEILERVENPFYTTRTTRSVGMGIPLFKMAAEQTGGSFHIESTPESENPDCHGTAVRAVFHLDHIDVMPLGDIVSTICTLIQGAPAIDWLFRHESDSRTVELDTRQVREVLGGDIPLDSFEVMEWMRQYLEEQYASDSI